MLPKPLFMVVFGYRVWPLLKRTWQEVMEDNILGLSAQTAYYFFFSLFPIFLFVAPLLSLIGDKEKVFGLLITQLGSAVPGEAFALVRGVVNDVVFAENAPGLISVGALLAAWAGSNVFSALIDAMNRAYDIEERRPWWKKKLVALASVLVTGITVGLATTILLSGEQIVNVVGNAIGLGPTAKALWTFLQIPLALTMLVTITALSFYFLPNLRPQSKKHVFAGALVTTALWVLVTLGCAVQRHGLSGGGSPLRQLSLRPVATGAAVAGNQAAESLWCKGVV